jgi:hypothetical protein
MLKKSTIVFVAILFFALLLVPKQSAALEVTPAISEISLTPGEETVAIIELENDTKETVQLTTEVVNFTAKEETGEPKFSEASPTGAALWIDVEEGPIVLQPAQTTEVAVTFNTPSSATPGGYYAAVLFSFVQPTNGEGAGQVTIESKVASLFLATVKGSYEEGGKIVTFGTVGDKTSYTEGPIAFNLRYQNTGDIHLRPTGTVTITSMFGSEVKTMKVNEDKGAILPDGIRKFEVASCEDLGNAFGKYTAKVTLTAGTVKSSATVDFWVISTMGIVIVVVVVIVLILLIVLLTKAAGRKKVDTTPTQ